MSFPIPIPVILVNQSEIEGLLIIFRKFAGASKKDDHAKIDRTKFRDVLTFNFGMTDDILMDRGMCCRI